MNKVPHKYMRMSLTSDNLDSYEISLVLVNVYDWNRRYVKDKYKELAKNKLLNLLINTL